MIVAVIIAAVLWFAFVSGVGIYMDRNP